jgi:hypothetical protein
LITFGALTGPLFAGAEDIGTLVELLGDAPPPQPLRINKKKIERNNVPRARDITAV